MLTVVSNTVCSVHVTRRCILHVFQDIKKMIFVANYSPIRVTKSSITEINM